MTVTTSSATFGVTERQGLTLVHDPATGLTHRYDGTLPHGRLSLDPQHVATWTTVAPREYPGTVPISLCWSPLVRCNLQCPHCLDDKAVKETGPAERARIARLLAASGVPGIDISGGEPLLLSDLPALADTLTGGGCTISVTTNGWHLRRRATELATHVDAVRVSLDGPTAPAHDAWRGEGSFHRAMTGIHAAVTAGIRVQIQTVLMASTCHDAQKILELAVEHGAGGVTFLQMLPIGEGAKLGPDRMLSDAAAAELLHRLAVPDGLIVRLRTRANAGGFTVVRADGQIWRNGHPAEEISTHRAFRSVEDLILTGPEGAA
ncbi:radical SAM protein [Actinoallomurus sp. NBC_01490]|uniref:radical SAM protein n=1 Tax=Actinoallomurus sp. NBC_01490 TaxID=2903557 RepID=UPI002E33B776|nr:radical SAM protein [Actinoallomurus sp. NBC_01490]